MGWVSYSSSIAPFVFVSARPQSLQHRDQEVAKAVVTEFSSSSRLPVRKHKKTRAQNRALFSTSQSLCFLCLAWCRGIMKTLLFPSSKVFFFPGRCSNWRTIYQPLQHNRSQLGYTNKLYHMQCLGRFLGVFQVNRGSPGDVANCTGILPAFKA